MTKIFSPKRWVGPPYYTSSSPFIPRVEIDLLLILNKQSLQSKAWSSSNQHWTTLNEFFFPKLTKNTKVDSATCYPDHQILSQNQGSPLPIFHFPCHPTPTSPSPNSGTTWSFVQVCVTQVRVPRKLCPPSSMQPSFPPTHLPQCPPSMLFPPLNALKPSLERPQQAQSAFGPDLGSFQALELLD